MNFTPIDNLGRVEGFCLVKAVELKTSAKGDSYLDFTLGDKSGEINAKLWRYSAVEHGEYASGDIVKIRGTISKYNGADQLRIEKIRSAISADGVDPADFVQSAAYKSEDMFGKLISICEQMQDEEIKKLVIAIYDDYKERLLYWPAAYRMHHAMRGGLLMHTLSIVRLAQRVCDVYPFVDRDLLLGGAMLHDIAKIKEFEVNAGGTVDNYSIKGNLLGHLTMGAAVVNEYAKKLCISEKTAVLLEHMILSHHGVPEFGAAVKPMFIEAEILSELDLMDARVFEMREAVSGAEKEDFSGRVYALDNIKLFNHGRTDLSRDPELI